MNPVQADIEPGGAVPAGGAADPAATFAATRVFLRPLANPLSLGFVGLFLATMLLTGLQLGWVPVTDTHMLALAVLVSTSTVPARLIACIYGFLTRDSVAATGMGILFGIWASVALISLMSPPGSHSPGLGLVLVLGAAALCMPAAGAAPAKRLAAAVMFSTAVRWGLTAAYEFSGSGTWEVAAGAAGLCLGLVALYATLAFEMEDQNRRTGLPTFRRGAGEVAMVGGLSDQVSRAANEAGVRKQL